MRVGGGGGGWGVRVGVVVGVDESTHSLQIH